MQVLDTFVVDISGQELLDMLDELRQSRPAAFLDAERMTLREVLQRYFLSEDNETFLPLKPDVLLTTRYLSAKVSQMAGSSIWPLVQDLTLGRTDSAANPKMYIALNSFFKSDCKCLMHASRRHRKRHGKMRAASYSGSFRY